MLAPVEVYFRPGVSISRACILRGLSCFYPSRVVHVVCVRVRGGWVVYFGGGGVPRADMFWGESLQSFVDETER